MWPNPKETADLVLFAEEILNGKLHFFVQCDCYWFQTLLVKRTMFNSNGRILILDVELEEHQLLLINIYNANMKTEQVQTLTTLFSMWKDFDFWIVRNN